MSFYYAKYLNEIKQLIDEMEDEDCVAIPRAKDLLNSYVVQNNLTFLMANYSLLPDVIEKLDRPFK